MFQKYQKYFNNNRYGYLLKYDGKRDNNKYTIRIFDQLDPENVYGKDTNNPEEEFKSILNMVELRFSSDENIMYSDFDSIIKPLLLRCGDKLICSMFFKGSQSDMSINLQLLYNDFQTSYNSSCMDDIKSFVNRIERR